MERNWLIRTSQNQILGPVAKQKLLEFIQKGALGLTDEVTSGNGYWFALKEKDLVEKYIYGDIPQSYNPISESKSVLAKRDNPEKTTSINTAPANKTQVLRASSLTPGIAPAADDLEFPEDITTIRSMPSLNLSKEEPAEDTKLPSSDDLEFPDLNNLVSSTQMTSTTFKYTGHDGLQSGGSSTSKPIPMPVEKVVAENNEPVVLPQEDDLAFPDMDEVRTSIGLEHGKLGEPEKPIAQPVEDHTKTVAVTSHPSTGKTKSGIKNFDNIAGEVNLTLDIPGRVNTEFKEDAATPKEKVRSHAGHLNDDKKLIHDRKMKSSKPSAQRDPNREVAHKEPAEPLKKRNDNYIFFILVILILIIVAVFFYFKEILNKPLPV